MIAILGPISFQLIDSVSNIFRYDGVIKWKHSPLYWLSVGGIHRSPVNSPQKGQWRGALVFYLIWAWTNGSVNNRDAGDLRRHRDHYEVTVMRSHNNEPTLVLWHLKLPKTRSCVQRLARESRNENINDPLCWSTAMGRFTSQKANNMRSVLTHCGLMTPYGDRDLGQHWLR